MTALYLIRHGETTWNRSATIQGQLDIPLSEKGVKQADALAKHISSENFAALYSSDLSRAYYTAKPLATRFGLAIQTDKRLRERNFGVLQGIKRADTAKEMPQHAIYRSEPGYVIPEGESTLQFAARCIDCFIHLAHQHPSDNILVITHGGVISSLMKYTLGQVQDSSRPYSVHNTGINVFSQQDNSWLLESWGDIRHLKNI